MIPNIVEEEVSKLIPVIEIECSSIESSTDGTLYDELIVVTRFFVIKFVRKIPSKISIIFSIQDTTVKIVARGEKETLMIKERMINDRIITSLFLIIIHHSLS